MQEKLENKLGNKIKENVFYFQCKHLYPISVIRIYYLTFIFFFPFCFEIVCFIKQDILHFKRGELSFQ
jgi:hypothetical protein